MKKFTQQAYRLLAVKTVCALLIIFIASGCFSVKPSTTKSGKNLYETFFVGEEGTQYFIKPIAFENSDKTESLLLDLTFRYKNEIKDSTVLNFTLEGPDIYKNFDAVSIANPELLAAAQNLELLFNETDKGRYISRFTAKISLADTHKLFQDNNWTLTLSSSDLSREYVPNKKNLKVIHTLRNAVFSIM